MSGSLGQTVFASLLLAGISGVNAQVLAPTNDILSPSTSTNQNPLQYAGGNSPYFAGTRPLFAFCDDGGP